MQYVLSHKNADFYYIYKIENEVMFGYKITRYLPNMHSFSEYDENQKIELPLSKVEDDRYVDSSGRKLFEYKVIGKIVAMKDSEYKLIV
jgi:hypothetical protein